MNIQEQVAAYCREGFDAKTIVSILYPNIKCYNVSVHNGQWFYRHSKQFIECLQKVEIVMQQNNGDYV